MKDKIADETGHTFNQLGRLRVSKLAENLGEISERQDLTFAEETYTEVEFILRDTQELLELDTKISAMEEEIAQIEHRVRAHLSKVATRHSRLLLAGCRRIGRLDLLIAKVRLARETQCCVPQLWEHGLTVEGLVNPNVSLRLAEQGQIFQPITIEDVTSVTVITGANMGGKSVALKSVGLAVAMAQMGLLVPARSIQFSLRSFIYFSQQDENKGQGLSSFGAEIESLAKVLPHKGQRGLYLLDEPAKGTNPQEGRALVAALVDWLKTGSSVTFIATHFPDLSSIDGITHLQVAGLAAVNTEQFLLLGVEGVAGLQKLMDHTLVPGKGGVPKDAIKVAAFLGLAPEILEKASQELGLSPREV